MGIVHPSQPKLFHLRHIFYLSLILGKCIFAKLVMPFPRTYFLELQNNPIFIILNYLNTTNGWPVNHYQTTFSLKYLTNLMKSKGWQALCSWVKAIVRWYVLIMTKILSLRLNIMLFYPYYPKKDLSKQTHVPLQYLQILKTCQLSSQV